MMKNIGTLCLASLTSTSAFAATIESTELTTPRGEKISVDFHVPENAKNLPAIIVAPGSGYHKELPIVKGLATAAANDGYVAVRFNWGFCHFDAVAQKCTGDYSDDLKNEMEDLTTVINAVRADSRVDATRIVLAGKSLGTMVSYPVFRNDPSLKALLLATPLCTSKDEQGNSINVGNEVYPDFASEKRPVVLLAGNQDPRCQPAMLYDFAKQANGNANVVIVGGDHSLELGKESEGFASRNAANIKLAIASLLQWANIALGK